MSAAPYGRLAGKVAIVTGSGGPMGKAVATRFIEEGASVGVCDHSDARVKAAAEELRQKLHPNAKLSFMRMDARKDDEVLAFCDQVNKELGPVDILINVVGGYKMSATSDLPVADLGKGSTPWSRWEETFELNLKPGVLFVKRLAPTMKERGYGRIVNVASMDAHGEPYRTDYSASKAAVMSFTRALAVELAPEVIVNCIAPGGIATLAAQQAVKAGFVKADAPFEYRAKSGRSIIIKRMGQPVEIANAALFLASEENAFMTGEVMRITGGVQANL